MERDDIVRLARVRMMDEVDPPWFKADDVEASLMNGMREAAERSLCLPFSYTLQTTDGKAQYLLKVDPVEIERVYLPDFDQEVQRRDRLWLDSYRPSWPTEANGTPRYYIQDPAYLTFTPIPTDIPTITATPPRIEVRGYERPQSLDDIYKFPAWMHADLAWWPVWELLHKPDSDRYYPDVAANALQQFELRFGTKRSATVLRINRLRDQQTRSGLRIA